jgi:8-oxo-dGTP pyrophosphatase MutT (NUDIX family)
VPIPEFVVALRAKIGHAPLPLSGVTAVVLDDRDRVLLVRRADNGRWALTTGCLEPGERPAAGALREVMEETGIEAAVDCLISIEALDLSTGPNGDEVYWLNIGFRCRLVRGDARVNDDESVEVAWFDVAAVPELEPHQARCLALALNDADPWFVGSSQSVVADGSA